MVIRKLGRDHQGLDPIRLYAALGPQGDTGAGLHDAARLDEFIERVRDSVTGSLSNAGRLHGIRAEVLFREVVVAIGDFGLLTDEDAGDVYFDAASGAVAVPDYRVVDREGQHMLVEVKGIRPGRALKPYALRSSDVDALNRYAQLTNASLLFALYWPDMNQWTLVPEQAFERKASKRQIDVCGAMMANQMFRLGDATIGTTPPLTLSIELEAVEEPMEGGVVPMRITKAEMSAAGVPLHDGLESNIAWTLFRYGRWEVGEQQTPHQDGDGWRIDFVSRPPGPEAQQLAERQGFMGVGALSSLYSSLFNEATLDEDGHVEQLVHEPIPGMIGALIPSDYWEQSDRQLKLWRLEEHPAH